MSYIDLILTLYDIQYLYLLCFSGNLGLELGIPTECPGSLDQFYIVIYYMK